MNGNSNKRRVALDREDWLYLGGALALSAGCSLIYAPSGLLCLGAFAVLPPIVSMFRTKGPSA